MNNDPITIQRGDLKIVACRSGKNYAMKVCKSLEEIAKERNDYIYDKIKKNEQLTRYERKERDLINQIEDDDGVYPAITEHQNFGEGRGMGEGERKTIVSDNLREKDVFLIQNPLNYQTLIEDDIELDNNLMEMFITAGTLWYDKARNISLVSLYYPYARGDKQHAKDGIPAKIFADMLKSVHINRIITMDLHADQIEGFFDIHLEHLHASPLLIYKFKDVFEGKKFDREFVKMGGPDVGSAKKVEYLAKMLGYGIVLSYKARDFIKKDTVKTKIIGKIGEDIIIGLIDDIFGTGSTIGEFQTEADKIGYKEIYVGVTFPIMGGNAIENIDKWYDGGKGKFKLLIGTDAITQNKEVLDKPWYYEINTSKFVARALWEIHTAGSVSKLYPPSSVDDLNLWIE
ncbi:ribose-phosphate diphosphokinase [Nanoarchaeota archaeon]